MRTCRLLPWLSNVLQSTTTNSIVGGALAELDGDPNTNFWNGVWDGVKMELVTGTISGIGNAAQYSIDNKVNFVTWNDKINVKKNFTFTK